MYTSKLTLAVAVMFGMLLSGCIKNDIPYPRIQANIAQIEVEKQLQAASVDSINRTITLFLDEAADIQCVKATSWVLTPAGAQWPDSAAFAAGIDMREPVETTVSLYQDYAWRISAVQTIERYFTVDGQIGASTIDPIGRRVIVYVPEHVDLRRVNVLSMKLAGPDAVYSPDIAGNRIDFSRPVDIKVTEHGRTVEWTLYVQATESTVTLDRVDAWTNVAWVYAAAQDGRHNIIQYRQADATEWIDLPAAEVSGSGGAITGRIIHLLPETSYVARAVSDDEISNEVEFTTQSLYSIPNGSMDDWWIDGKVWNPWPAGGESYWDTGNKGATTLGTSNTFPTDDTSTGSGQAACLETRFVGIGSIGKLAAGNLFAGVYVRTDGTNGVIDMGRPFTLHPTRLRGMLKYKCVDITHATSGFEDRIGQPDTGIIWCALIDSDAPFQIRTNPNNRNLFDPEAPYVVAYGKVEYNYNVDNYQPFSIELEYRDTGRVPKYMLIVASASALGDYFTGGNGSTLWVDNFELDFDY